MTLWGDLDARARGLATHLRSREALERLAACPDPVALARALGGTPAAETPPEPADVERRVRRQTGERMALLARWAGPRVETLRVVFEDEERRSVRALLRGAAQAAPAAARLAGLVPTPGLAAEALERLAAPDTIEGAVRALADTGHPWGAPLLAMLESGPFDLFTLEIETSRIFARRARASARRGGRHLRGYVRRLVDLENAWTALLSDGLSAGDAAAAWIDGGEAVTRAAYDAATTAEATVERREILAEAFGGSPLGAVFGDFALPVSRLDGAVLAARIAEQRAAARVDPLGPAPLLEYALRLRAEAVDLRRIAWGVTLGAPAETIADELVSAR